VLKSEVLATILDLEPKRHFDPAKSKSIWAMSIPRAECCGIQPSRSGLIIHSSTEYSVVTTHRLESKPMVLVILGGGLFRCRSVGQMGWFLASWIALRS
jgi:hypothetical protein